MQRLVHRSAFRRPPLIKPRERTSVLEVGRALLLLPSQVSLQGKSRRVEEEPQTLYHHHSPAHTPGDPGLWFCMDTA